MGLFICPSHILRFYLKRNISQMLGLYEKEYLEPYSGFAMLNMVRLGKFGLFSFPMWSPGQVISGFSPTNNESTLQQELELLSNFYCTLKHFVSSTCECWNLYGSFLSFLLQTQAWKVMNDTTIPTKRNTGNSKNPTDVPTTVLYTEILEVRYLNQNKV